MNKTKSLILLGCGILWLAAVVFGFAKGAGQEEPGAKAAWIVGSLLFAALGVWLSMKIQKKKD
jgi:hypothetical protein